MQTESIHPIIYAGLRAQKINVDLIERLVSEHFGIGVYSIRNLYNREYELMEAKYACYHFIFKYMGYGKSRIGNLYKRNHASIINALRRVQGWIDTDPTFCAKMEEVEAILIAYQAITILENGEKIH
jgi:chromosomal replication initiation ATPase DnaA